MTTHNRDEILDYFLEVNASFCLKGKMFSSIFLPQGQFLLCPFILLALGEANCHVMSELRSGPETCL